jgi:hypothetical protein
MRDVVRTAIVLLAVTAVVGACAVIQPPPGGPEDKRPPEIVETTPRADSAGVARNVAPAIVFSEKVDPASFKNRIFVYPPMEFDRIAVKGERLEIRFKDELPETTVCLLVRAGIKDYHSVESKQNYLLFFSTADSIARGVISGVILYKEKPDSTGVAELFAVRGDTTPDLRTAKRVRVSFAAKDGRFELPGLPADGSKFILRGFGDRDGDSRFSEGKEFAEVYPSPIVLDPSRERVDEIRINTIDPNEPGSIEGRILNETGLAAAPTVRLSPAGAGKRSFTALADSTGAFVLWRVAPGAYLFSAFIDMKADTLCGTYFAEGDTTRALNEPCVALSDTLRLKPGEIKTLPPVTIK